MNLLLFKSTKMEPVVVVDHARAEEDTVVDANQYYATYPSRHSFFEDSPFLRQYPGACEKSKSQSIMGGR